MNFAYNYFDMLEYEPTATTMANKFIKGKNWIHKTRVYIAYEIPRLKNTAKIVAIVNIIEPVYAQIQSVTKIKPASTKLASDNNNRSNSVLFRPSCMP